jgi:hypothetical protein
MSTTERRDVETVEQWKARFHTETEVLLNELKTVGCKIESCFQLRSLSPSEFVLCGPVLLKHLRMSYSADVLHVLALPFGRKEARPFRNELITLFKEPGAIDGAARDQIGFGIAFTTNLQNIDDTMGILSATSVPGRVPVLLGLRRYRNRPEVAKFISTIRGDAEFQAEFKQWRI